MNIFSTLFDDEKKEQKRMLQIAQKVDSLASKYQVMSDEELCHKTEEFKERLKNGETLKDIEVEAFATIREAAKRVTGMFPFLEQIEAAHVLAEGNLAEMKTGEGKTLTSVLPIYLNALEGKGVHVVTVNEYLSQRDAELNGEIFAFLGLTTGVNLQRLSPEEKREAYSRDITYTTNSELGFDYLRDNMVKRAEKRVQRGLNFALIDEADSVLVDEAKTPLIISGGRNIEKDKYVKADTFVKSLESEDYEIDEKYREIFLTDSGNDKADKYYGVNNIYDFENSEIVHHLNQSLKANYIFKRDVDYMVENGEVFLIDQSTGRKMIGREYSDGLQQAIQVKEGAIIHPETVTQATITYQNFFRLYNKLAGMTGTAKTEEEEFLDIYNMRVVRIPTHKPVIRVDAPDIIYATKNNKYKAIINKVKEIHETGQPILIGTPSVEVSEIIDRRLSKTGIPHNTLNAKYHDKEADIISRAGQKGAVTVATNMAGRGTDIKLGEGVRELGGLYVIGVEKHESRRIDNQLKGRSGRQGDPGFSQFYVSLEDDLMVRFGAERIKDMMSSLGDLAIENSFISKSIENAQKQVEGFNYDTRKSLLQYDQVLNQQRQIVYKKRDDIIDNEKATDFIEEMVERFINREIKQCFDKKDFNRDRYLKTLERLNLDDIFDINGKELESEIFKAVMEVYNEKKAQVGDTFYATERLMGLSFLDREWVNHIDAVYKLREGIKFRGYATQNPLGEYSDEAYELFEEMINVTSERITDWVVNLFKNES